MFLFASNCTEDECIQQELHYQSANGEHVTPRMVNNMEIGSTEVRESTMTDSRYCPTKQKSKQRWRNLAMRSVVANSLLHQEKAIAAWPGCFRRYSRQIHCPVHNNILNKVLWTRWKIRKTNSRRHICIPKFGSLMTCIAKQLYYILGDRKATNVTCF